MTVNSKKDKYAEAYQVYSEFYSNYGRQKHPLLTFSAFKTHYIFVIDCPRRNDIMKLSAVDLIKLFLSTLVRTVLSFTIDLWSSSHSAKSYLVLLRLLLFVVLYTSPLTP